MSLKSVLIKIRNLKQGIVMGMYNRQFRWTGVTSLVDLMAGTDILRIDDVANRLQQTYRALELLPEGVPHEQ
eukprot:9301509-Prorocentrum_lima.AAC.1